MNVIQAKEKRPPRPRPIINDDTDFFWNGLKAGKLLIQKCTGCQVLRHPSSPMCPECHSLDWGTIEATGKGVIYSFVIMHHPELPPFDYPNPIGLIELEEGVRIVGGLTGIKPEEIKIGIPVQAEITKFDDDLTLAMFRPVSNKGGN